MSGLTSINQIIHAFFIANYYAEGVHLCRLLNLYQCGWEFRVEDTIYIWLGLLRPYLLTHEVP